MSASLQQRKPGREAVGERVVLANAHYVGIGPGWGRTMCGGLRQDYGSMPELV
jgi:hypothetical protein